MRSLSLIMLLFLMAFSTVMAQTKRPITVEDMWNMKRVSDVTLSPDGNTIAFTVKTYSMEENKGQSDIWLIDSNGENLRPLLNSEVSESSPHFTPDGKNIMYSYKSQIWTCDLEGNNKEQVTDLYTGVSGLVWNHDGSNFLFTSKVYPDCTTQECNEKKDKEEEESKVKAKIITELMYKHWDEWRGDKRAHLFLFNMETKEYTDLTEGSEFDVPPLALGSASDYAFSPDGKEIAFAMNDDEMIAASTNNDVYVMSYDDMKPVMISTSPGNDNHPVYSPDGKYLAYRSMARGGFEADTYNIVVLNRETGEAKNISEDVDMSVGQMVWSPDSKSIYFTADYEIYKSFFKIDVETGKYEAVLKERYNSDINISPDGKMLYFSQQRTTQPYEVFSLNLENDEVKQLTHFNKDLLAELEMNEIETFWSEGANGAKVQSILTKPPYFDPNKKYPMIFLVHGGPQGHWSDNFHYRWNHQLFASKGYVVVAPNPRGSSGYGEQFKFDISKDWGGKVFTDLMNTYDNTLETYDFIDENNTFSAGASYGGYMMAWFEGHTDFFNALVNHDGVYNLESMYGTTEELWFPEWEYNGAPWEAEAKEYYEKWSPSNYVENFKTPMLVIQGALDYRVPEGQAFELFTALQKMGVDSKLLYFPDENHWVLKPQNSRLWWKTVFDWYEQHKK